MLYVNAERPRPLPGWVMLSAIGQFVVSSLVGIALLLGTATGHLPVGDFDQHILQQGDVAGYVILWVALLWISLCLLAAAWARHACDQGVSW